jgi:hypothetical protein
MWWSKGKAKVVLCFFAFETNKEEEEEEEEEEEADLIG